MKRCINRIVGLAAASLGLGLVLLVGWLFATEDGTNKRYMLADTLLTTKHREWAKYVIGPKNAQARATFYMSRFDTMGEEPAKVTVQPMPPAEQRPLVEIEKVEGDGWIGYVASISDPSKLRVVATSNRGKGEKVTEMVHRTGAIAGVNGGGYLDPNWDGNGFVPVGVVISGGELLFNDAKHDKPTHLVGIDKAGAMVAGKYRPSDMIKMGVQEGVTFYPRLIVDGVGLIQDNTEGFGLAPRTGMAQKHDGTILFAVIDGRSGSSLGATLYDLQQLFLERDVVIAANLDGGASAILVHDGNVVNNPSASDGERDIPTAWIVHDRPDSIIIDNVWKGYAPDSLNPSKQN